MRTPLLAFAVLLTLAVPATAASRGPNDLTAFFTWDAKRIVFERDNGPAATVWVTAVGHGVARRLGPGVLRGTRPGGDEALVERDGSSYVYTLKGSTVVGFPGRSATWSPDGGKIAFLREGTLHVISSTGAGARDLGVPVVSPGWDTAGPVWSPDGEQIVIAAREGS